MSTVTILAKETPISGEWVTTDVPANQSLTEIFGADASECCQVSIGGHPVPRAMWNKVRPRAGQIVHAVGVPAGGSGGKVLRTVAMVALVALSQGVASGAIGSSIFGSYAAVAGAGIMIAGSLVMSPMIGQPLHITEDKA